MMGGLLGLIAHRGDWIIVVQASRLLRKRQARRLHHKQASTALTNSARKKPPEDDSLIPGRLFWILEKRFKPRGYLWTVMKASLSRGLALFQEKSFAFSLMACLATR
jgi:hypothetical protein